MPNAINYEHSTSKSSAAKVFSEILSDYVSFELLRFNPLHSMMNVVNDTKSNCLKILFSNYDDENLKITGYNEHFINNR